jgi:hypothetical protein
VVTNHQMWATAVVVWLIGLFTAWCIGYAARDRPDPAPHRNLAGQLSRVRLDSIEELDRLDDARRHCDAHRLPAPAPVAVHVHVAPPLPWPPSHAPLPLNIPRFLDAMPVLPVEEVQS